MSTCSIDKSSSMFDKLLKQILNYIKADCTVLGRFHYFIKEPRGSRSKVTVLEIKIDNPKLKDEYEVTAALKIASEYLRKSRYFILSENFDGWAEITKAEYKALELLNSLKKHERIRNVEYDAGRCEVVINRKNSKTTCFSVNTVDEFLRIVEAMEDIQNGNFYARIKEEKHE